MMEMLAKKSQVAPLHVPPNFRITGSSQMRASYAQQRVWSDELSSSGLSNTSMFARIKHGFLSIERIRSAIRATVERHQILRTAVYRNDESKELQQKVQILDGEKTDLFQLTHYVEAPEKLDAFLTADSSIPFANIDNGLVFRCHLISMHAAEFEYLYAGDLIVFTFHRIAFDTNSVEPFLQTFVQAYDGIEFTTSIPQYIDFTSYQYEQLMDPNPNSKMNRARRFWSTIMNGYDFSNTCMSPKSSNLRHSVALILDCNLVDAQTHFASANSITMWQLNLACYFIFLHKVSSCNTNDLCVTSFTDNRVLNETKTMIGTFVNLLPYRIKIRHTEYFVDFIQKVQQLCIGTFEHAQLPYQQIVDVDRNSTLPHIPFHFHYESKGIPSMSGPTFEIKVQDATVDVSTNRDQFDDNVGYRTKLHLIMKHDDQAGTMHCTLSGSADLYDKAEVSAISQYFQHLLLRLFSSTTTTKFDQTVKPISKLPLFRSKNIPKMQRTDMEEQPSVVTTETVSDIFRSPTIVTNCVNYVTVSCGRKNYCQKWLSFIWFLFELNLISANIFGFTALSKVLPVYGIYDKYCKPSNATLSTGLDCSEQTKQYQSAQTLGLIFFNISSFFIGVLIDKYGCRFTKLLAVILHVIGWLALALIKPGRDSLLYVHTLFISISGKAVQMTGYTSCNYFSKARAFTLTALAGSSTAAAIWYSIFQVLINNQILTLTQLSYIWLSFGVLMVISSFLFLDWKFQLLNLPYNFDTKFEKVRTRRIQGSKWYMRIQQRTGIWKHLTNPLYILVVLFLSVLLMPSVFLAVTWYSWVYYITDNNKELADTYTLAYNLSLLTAIIFCPISGFIIGFRAEKSKKRKLLNIAIVQTYSWALNIVSCIIYMFAAPRFIIPALVLNCVARSAVVSGSQAVISTHFPSKYVGRLTGVMWTTAGVIICMQYGLVKLTEVVPQSWRAWVIILALIIVMSCHLVQVWVKYVTELKKPTSAWDAEN